MRHNCPDHDGLLSYLQLYYCALAGAKPLAFIILILWLSLLFSTIGIAASDFLCIDLSTLASILGLSESLTGVTFLAFGNGSPDVFSTFAAMRSNSGSLAIGELIGAATFISSVVAGSMALVRPFKVARRSFIRDVGYFVVAVSFSMVLLADGRLHVWEAATMVGLYVFYVVLVVTWHWYLVRQRRKYERDLAARTHFHIPENQELEVDEPMEDDDPGVASGSQSLLRGASTDDFDLLERTEGIPMWKEEDDEDDETRDRYLAEIRDNMHVYRPPLHSRRNTVNPIRPSLVGALEFQSVLHSLQKSRNHRNPNASLRSYSEGVEDSSRPYDTLSIASHPCARRSTTTGDRLSPLSTGGPSRARAVSANDADGLRLEPGPSGEQSSEQTPHLTLRRPSTEPDAAARAVSPSPSQHPSGTPSITETAGSRTPDLLAPPNFFHSPHYQNEVPHDRSPSLISPRGGTGNPLAEIGTESPGSPFPTYFDEPSPLSTTRAPGIRLPLPAVSPSEQLLFHDGATNETSRFAVKNWWPYSILPAPQQIGCTLFPTLAGWKSKGITERLLGVVAAPSVFLLTITVPIVEPQDPKCDESDLSAVVIEQDGNEVRRGPRVRLPDESPVIDSLEAISSATGPETLRHPHQKSGHHESARPRWDSELPPAPPSHPPGGPASVKDWNRWLVCIQLFTGPFFFTLIAWSTVDETANPRNLLLPALISLAFSCFCLTALISTTRRRPWHHGITSQTSPNAPSEPLPPRRLPPAWRTFLALLGFLVAISWIATIAEEVVSLLKTLGVILNISDSLLGLTVFAVGNSLGDLVADITVARLGYPVMALSACFGGPMLNILLGIGLGGLYMTLHGGTHKRHNEIVSPTRVPYEIAISKVLVISGATLLVVLVGLLIVVPLNHWRMDRKIGWGLVVVWCVSTLGNVIAELVT